MFDWVMSLMVVAICALLGGAAFMWRRGERQRAVLMAVAALVIAGNVALWTMPVAPIPAAPVKAATAP